FTLCSTPFQATCHHMMWSRTQRDKPSGEKFKDRDSAENFLKEKKDGLESAVASLERLKKKKEENSRTLNSLRS
ncbi:hypothetical protein, partial [Roseospira navarrensis]|uniref:hypothetical protein n=1 Tax=Roseospira navarrensis TaxID=140058 RepID=UPI001B871E98